MSVEAAPGSAGEDRSAHQWPHAANAVLGLWLATAPATYGVSSGAALASDIASGVLIVVLSGLACSRHFPWARWMVGAIGLWLLAAPLVFWSPAAAYATNMLVGTLVIAFALLVPGMSGAGVLS
ncbi:MAG: hypothetical protein WD872_11205 [Pirellulaceae bacterium]